LKNSGFTLAETLITLGIIGLVAAMTIPNIMTKIQELQTVTKLKATYSMLLQVLKIANEEIGTPEDWGITGRNAKSGAIIAQNLKPYMKIAVDCGMGSNRAPEKCFPPKSKSLNGTDVSSKYINSKYYVKLLNGTSVAFEGERGGGIYMYFLVDINGNTQPNTWGIDIFEFSYTSKGLVPSGHIDNPSNTYKNSCISKKSSGTGCAYYVLNTGKMDYLKKK